LGVSSAQSNEMNQEHMEKIRKNCLQSKNSLSQLHRSDALLRVNRGQLYESISTKLMSRFNSRVSSAGHNSSNLSTITRDYAQELDQFREDYIAYEEQLSSAESINCTKQPVAFYDAVVGAHEKRQTVRDTVAGLNQMLDDYRRELLRFETSLLKEDN